MADDDLREEFERLQSDVEGLEERLASIEAALDREEGHTRERARAEADHERSGTDNDTVPIRGEPDAPASAIDDPTTPGGSGSETVGGTGRSADEPIGPVPEMPSPTTESSRGSQETGTTPPSDAGAPTPTDADTVASPESTSSPPADAASSESAKDLFGSDDSDAGASDESASDDGRNLELDLGGRWLGIVGAIALTLGVAFLVSVAIDRGWIGADMQLALGAITGVAVTAGGRYAATRRGYDRWGMIVAGGGIGITYVVWYAAYAIETYRAVTGLTLPGGIAVLSVIVGVAVVLGVRDDTRIVAGESFALGYLTLWLARDLGPFVLAAVVVLAVGVAATVAVRRWRWLPPGAVFGSYTLYWLGVSETPTLLVEGVALVALLVAFGAAALLSLGTRGPDALSEYFHTPPKDDIPTDTADDGGRSSSIESLARTLPSLTTLSNAGLFAVSAYALLGEIAPNAQAVLFVALAAAAVGYDVLTRSAARRRDPVVPYLAVGFFLTVPPVAFDGAAFTLGLAVVTLVVGVLAGTADEPHYRRAGHAVAVFLGAKVLLLDVWTLDPVDLAAPVSLGAAHAGVGAAVALALLAVGERSQFDQFQSYIPVNVPTTTPEEAISGDVLSEEHAAWLGETRFWVVYVWLALTTLAAGLAAGAGGGPWWSVAGSALVLALLAVDRQFDATLVGYSADVLAATVVGAVLFVHLPSAPAFDPTAPVAGNRIVAALAGILACYAGFVQFDREDRWAGPDASRVLSARFWYARAGTVLVLALLVTELSGFPASAAWALFGLALLGTGVAVGSTDLRYQSLAVLLATTAKVFVVDTSGLDPLARALSFIVLAVILLAASYLYARFADRIIDTGSGSNREGTDSDSTGDVRTTSDDPPGTE